MPLQPELEDYTITMDPANPSSTATQEETKATRATVQASGPSSSTARAAPAEMPKSKGDQMAYLFRLLLGLSKA